MRRTHAHTRTLAQYNLEIANTEYMRGWSRENACTPHNKVHEHIRPHMPRAHAHRVEDGHARTHTHTHTACVYVAAALRARFGGTPSQRLLRRQRRLRPVQLCRRFHQFRFDCGAVRSFGTSAPPVLLSFALRSLCVRGRLVVVLGLFVLAPRAILGEETQSSRGTRSEVATSCAVPLESPVRTQVSSSICSSGVAPPAADPSSGKRKHLNWVFVLWLAPVCL